MSGKKAIKESSKSSKPKADLSAAASSTEVRRLKKPRYRSFRFEKRIKYTAPETPGTIKTMLEAWRFMRKHWKIMLGMSAVYAVLYILIVRGIRGSIDYAFLKSELIETTDALFDGNLAEWSTTAGLLGIIFSNPLSGDANVAASFYQSVLFIVFALAVIWAMRQLYAGNAITYKEAYYKGMYPLIPFILVMGIIGLQCIPVMFGTVLLQTVNGGDFAVTLAEQVIWALLWFLMFLASAYMVSGSVFALIVVTLPDMTPIKSVKGAYEMLRFRRMVILRRLALYVVIMLVSMVTILLPTLIFAVQLTGVVYLLWSIFSVIYTLNYFYAFYRGLLPK